MIVISLSIITGSINLSKLDFKINIGEKIQDLLMSINLSKLDFKIKLVTLYKCIVNYKSIQTGF